MFRKNAQNRIMQNRNSAILREMNDCAKYNFFAQKCSATKVKCFAFFAIIAQKLSEWKPYLNQYKCWDHPWIKN